MKIQKLEYYDDEYKWKLEAVNFLPNLNLLVGVSGAGKTRILRAINSLRGIADGASLNGVQWKVCFLADNDSEYHWSGKFETRESIIPIDSDSEKENQVKIIHEELTCNGDFLASRTQEEILFGSQKTKTPKLSPFESIVDLLKEEDVILPVKKALRKIILVPDNRSNQIWRLPISIFKKHEKSSLSFLKESDLPVLIKLAILCRTLPEEFEKIKKIFISIFPSVLDVKLETINENEELPIVLSQLMKDLTIIKIKEKGVEDWIENVSSGMQKTLMYISELYLAPDNSVVLIDEFENSLGVNCLDSVTELILSNQELQFIITSHHPYIINNISPVYWGIVTRKGSSVTVKKAKDFHISDSRQKAFIDLINVLEDEDLEG